MTNDRLTTLLKSSVRSDDAPSETSSATTVWKARLAALIPLGILLGFVLLLVLLLGERLMPAREVALETVVTVRAEAGVRQEATPTAGDPYAAPMLFQASGWIEPDPLPIKATALVDGVVDRVEVLEGATVEKGQVLATLIDEDARLDLETARSRLASLRAQEAAHHGLIQVIEAEVETLKKQLVAAEAKRTDLADRARRLTELPKGNVPEREVAEARLQLATQEAEIEAVAATEQELRGKWQQHREMAKDFTARVKEAETEVARRQLALDRTRILSPVDGIVLRLLAVPGQKRMLGMDDPDSATIAILYQPDHLQARIDVPLEEAAQLAGGQPVRVRSNFLPDRTFRGTVTRIVGEADLQRNTLQAKVRIQDPDSRLRPEMLCRAEFLALTSGRLTSSDSGAVANERVNLYVPESALLEASGNEAQVWLLDASGKRVVRQTVQLGPEKREDHRLVLDGLKPGDRVVTNPPGDLKPGQRIKPKS
tara:strand:- start:4919 stop:6370 length:1452 start_codon:yes stop_codon:yes gene_type:complete